MKRLVCAFLILFSGIPVTALNAAAAKGGGVCQILDVPLEPVVQLSGGYITDASVEGHDDVSMTEAGVYWNFAHFWDVLFGDVDLAMRVNSTFFSEEAGIELPSHVSRVAVDVGWTGRFREGTSFQARIFPGMYSDFRDFDGDAFAMPFSVALIKAFDSKKSGIVGLEIRPDFQQKVMPMIGLGMMINERTRLDARLPESRFAYYLGKGWSAQAGFKWQNMTYAVHENGLGAEKLTVEDFRLSCGLTWRVSDNLQFTGEVGRLVGRSFEYNESTDRDDYDVDGATLCRFVLGGPF